VKQEGQALNKLVIRDSTPHQVSLSPRDSACPGPRKAQSEATDVGISKSQKTRASNNLGAAQGVYSAGRDRRSRTPNPSLPVSSHR
jgi:hypothetical protein